MRKYRVDYILSTKDNPETEIIEADSIYTNGHFVQFHADNPADNCYEGRIVAIRQNCNVTEITTVDVVKLEWDNAIAIAKRRCATEIKENGAVWMI